MICHGKNAQEKRTRKSHKKNAHEKRKRKTHIKNICVTGERLPLLPLIRHIMREIKGYGALEALKKNKNILFFTDSRRLINCNSISRMSIVIATFVNNCLRLPVPHQRKVHHSAQQ